MVDQITALKNAYKYVLRKYSCGSIGDMFITPVGGVYRVRLVELASRGVGKTYEIDVDAVSGEIMGSNIRNTVEGYYIGQVKGLIDGNRACEAALKAISGYEYYDKKGSFTVRLHTDSYVVTFPLIPSGGSGERGADYAYQILVDARTGEVSQILTAS